MKLQAFYTQNYDKENGARLQWYMDNKRGQSGGPQASRQGSRTAALNHGLPTINPMEYARNKKRAEEEHIRQIRLQARQQQSKEEMRKPDPKLFGTLYDGFTKEEKGRYQYLKKRHTIIPEKKFNLSNAELHGLWLEIGPKTSPSNAQLTQEQDWLKIRFIQETKCPI